MIQIFLKKVKLHLDKTKNCIIIKEQKQKYNELLQPS